MYSENLLKAIFSTFTLERPAKRKEKEMPTIISLTNQALALRVLDKPSEAIKKVRQEKHLF